MGNVRARFSFSPGIKGRFGGSGLLALICLGRPFLPYNSTVGVDGRVGVKVRTLPAPQECPGSGGGSHASFAPVGVTRARSLGKITCFPSSLCQSGGGEGVVITLVR